MTTPIFLGVVLVVPLLLLIFSKRPDVPMWMHTPLDEDAPSRHVPREDAGSFGSSEHDGGGSGD